MQRHIIINTKMAASSPQRKMKVAVLGAAGGIGQPMSLLLKLSPYVSELNLFDIVNSPGVAADLSHIDSHARVLLFMFLHNITRSTVGERFQGYCRVRCFFGRV